MIKDFKQLYEKKPRFVKDILHLNYFQVPGYFEISEIFRRIQISPALKFLLHATPAVEGFKIENGEYIFKCRKNSFLMIADDLIDFRELFESLQKIKPNSDSDIAIQLIESNIPPLVWLGVNLQGVNSELAPELKKYLMSAALEDKKWTIGLLTEDNLDNATLAINKSAWKPFTYLDLNSVFGEIANSLVNIDFSKCSEEQIIQLIKSINRLIDEEASKISNMPSHEEGFVSYFFKKLGIKEK
jgi:hypothetical protein